MDIISDSITIGRRSFDSKNSLNYSKDTIRFLDWDREHENSNFKNILYGFTEDDIHRASYVSPSGNFIIRIANKADLHSAIKVLEEIPEVPSLNQEESNKITEIRPPSQKRAEKRPNSSRQWNRNVNISPSPIQAKEKELIAHSPTVKLQAEITMNKVLLDGKMPATIFQGINYAGTRVAMPNPPNRQVQPTFIVENRKPVLNTKLPVITSPFVKATHATPKLRNSSFDVAKKYTRAMTKPNQVTYSCPICLDDINLNGPEPFKVLPNCKGLFHKACLKMHIDQAIKDKKYPLTCPDENCKQVIPENILEQIMDQAEMTRLNKLKRLYKLLQNPGSFMYCPTPDCRGIFKLLKNSNTSFSSPLQCWDCQKPVCIKCQKPYHFGLTCYEFRTFTKEDYEVSAQLSNNKWKKCMNCRFWIEKNEGCNHMTCKCGNSFCYVCGKKWRTCHC